MFSQSLIPSDPSYFFQFILAAGVALAAAAPIGAISILTIQRAISLGFMPAFLPTLGAVMGNGIFGVIAALGSGYLSTSIIGSRVWLRLMGSVILMLIGARILTRRREDLQDRREVFGKLQLGLLKFTLVLSNPLTLGFYLAAFAMLGLESTRLLSARSFVLGGGIIFGAILWFVFICTAAAKFHLKVGDALLGRIRVGVGIILVLLGMFSAVSLLVRG
jgi:threonine/homoserine/homoserine lactone efflux protein